MNKHKIILLFLIFINSLIANEALDYVKLTPKEEAFLRNTKIQVITSNSWAPINMYNDKDQLAGIAIDEVITSSIVSEYKFEVTGSIQEPSFKEVDRKTQNISVGRDSPPQIVENIPVIKPAKTGRINPETGLIEEQQPQLEKNDG